MLTVTSNCKPRRSDYTELVLETASAGFGDLEMLADNRRSAVFLRPCACARLYDQRVGLGGETFGSAGANVPVRQPRSVPAHPFGDGRRAFNRNVGGRTMLRHISARPEQLQSPLEFLRIALRAAAMSDRPNDAIDVLADALLRLAAITEVRHA
ncbi:hypothetical protein [Burkholderia gladioli]|uniref:hypothetical protein n=1 Tax=Burkholderia gladioli TaxID=28095 RepID=UPI00264EADD2|nr:hypothetical protein [Burkholderia gladioli]MDN7602231.1 hypothetical protein [Burkholderia gladioli]